MCLTVSVLVFLQHKGIEIWSRPIMPLYQNYFSYAVAFVNRRTDGTPSDVAVTLKELGLSSPTGYRVEVRTNKAFVYFLFLNLPTHSPNVILHLFD